MKFTGHIENDGNVLFEQLTFDLDPKTNLGMFVLSGKDRGRLNINKDYTIVFSDGRTAEMIMTSQHFKTTTHLEVVGFAINWVN